jgi:hypothetical protein
LCGSGSHLPAGGYPPAAVVYGSRKAGAREGCRSRLGRSLNLARRDSPESRYPLHLRPAAVGLDALIGSCAPDPRFHAAMTGPVGPLVEAMLRNVSMANETSIFISDAQREALLRSVFDTFYAGATPGHVVFDTNRLWCTKLPLLATLFPKARVICCVRDIPWIFDSIERLIRKNKSSQASSIFEPSGNVYSRVKGLGAGNGLATMPGTRCMKRGAANRPAACC